MKIKSLVVVKVPLRSITDVIQHETGAACGTGKCFIAVSVATADTPWHGKDVFGMNVRVG